MADAAVSLCLTVITEQSCTGPGGEYVAAGIGSFLKHTACGRIMTVGIGTGQVAAAEGWRHPTTGCHTTENRAQCIITCVIHVCRYRTMAAGATEVDSTVATETCCHAKVCLVRANNRVVADLICAGKCAGYAVSVLWWSDIVP